MQEDLTSRVKSGKVWCLVFGMSRGRLAPERRRAERTNERTNERSIVCGPCKGVSSSLRMVEFGRWYMRFGSRSGIGVGCEERNLGCVLFGVAEWQRR